MDTCRRRFTLFFIFAFCSFFSLSAFTSDPPADSTTVHKAELDLKDQLFRSLLIDRAKQYIGLGYRYGGSSPATGFDCSGFTSYLMKQFNISLLRSSSAQATQGKKITLDEARPGDLVMFKRSRRGGISHVAMVVSNGKEGVHIIHSTSRGIVIDNLNQSDYWRPKVYAVRNVVSSALTVAKLPGNIPSALASLSENDRVLVYSLSRKLPFMSI